MTQVKCRPCGYIYDTPYPNYSACKGCGQRIYTQDGADFFVESQKLQGVGAPVQVKLNLDAPSASAPSSPKPKPETGPASIDQAIAKNLNPEKKWG